MTCSQFKSDPTQFQNIVGETYKIPHWPLFPEKLMVFISEVSVALFYLVPAGNFHYLSLILVDLYKKQAKSCWPFCCASLTCKYAFIKSILD